MELNKKIAYWLSVFEREQTDLMKDLNIETDDDFMEWYAEAITLGSKKFLDLLKKKAQISVLSKLIQEEEIPSKGT